MVKLHHQLAHLTQCKLLKVLHQQVSHRNNKANKDLHLNKAKVLSLTQIRTQLLHKWIRHNQVLNNLVLRQHNHNRPADLHKLHNNLHLRRVQDLVVLHHLLVADLQKIMMVQK
jgi:carbamoylphosphate synthase small subunit